MLSRLLHWIISPCFVSIYFIICICQSQFVCLHQENFLTEEFSYLNKYLCFVHIYMAQPQASNTSGTTQTHTLSHHFLFVLMSLFCLYLAPPQGEQ